MKFKSVLIDRQLDKENLPPKLQKKISQLEKIEEDINWAEQEAKDPDDTEGIAVAKVRLSSLDSQLVKLLKDFDPVKYQQQKDKMAKINAKKYGKGKKVSEPDANVDEANESVVDESEVEQQVEDSSILEQIPPISKTLHIKESLDKLKEEVEIDPSSLEPERQPLEEVVEPEIEEFEKHEGTKPKKMSKGLILMGVGAFLLTWGAVNFFRERRG